MTSKTYQCIGLMSGTSLDGIDAALIATDGRRQVKPLGFVTIPYQPAFREKLRACFGIAEGVANPAVAAASTELTRLHAEAVAALLKRTRHAPEAIDLIGFHGQTIWHKPHERQTCQIGDGAMLAALTKIPVVNDFRTADVVAGGQGAPLVPLYHAARAATMPRPLAVLNIGGVANITWLGACDRPTVSGGRESLAQTYLGNDDDIIAFDTGPGNALLDDWMLRHTGVAYDADGKAAAAGQVDWGVVNAALARDYFKRPAPKSLDRNEFSNLKLEHLNTTDGAATLAMLTVAAVVRGLQQLNKKPLLLLVTGGGRHHPAMMRWLGEMAGCPAQPVESVGWNGDALEAEAFAYLAARHAEALPLSLPSTTGVPAPMPGGVLHRAA